MTTTTTTTTMSSRCSLRNMNNTAVVFLMLFAALVSSFSINNHLSSSDSIPRRSRFYGCNDNIRRIISHPITYQSASTSSKKLNRISLQLHPLSRDYNYSSNNNIDHPSYQQQEPDNFSSSSSSSSSSTPSSLSSNPSIQPPRNRRDMEPLSVWALSWGVLLAPGIQLTEDTTGDWSLCTQESTTRGSPVLTIPSHLILTSAGGDTTDDAYPPYYDETDGKNVRTWMELEMGPQSRQQYLPEFILVYKLLREVWVGKNSRWHAWWQSLPTVFDTGLYLDDVERNYVSRMADEYLQAQDLQFEACLGLMRKLIAQGSYMTSSNLVGGRKPLLPPDFHRWALELQSTGDGTTFENMVKWAFTVVFTRSWRTPDKKHASIVPLGDLANHDSQLANLQPVYRPADDAFQFFTTKDVVGSETNPGQLYLSYGMSYLPARFLVLFGFCDVSAAYVDAHLDFLDEDRYSKFQEKELWPRPLDPTQLVVSTATGVIGEDVWLAFLFKALQDHDPEQLVHVNNVYRTSRNQLEAEAMLESLQSEWEWHVANEMKSHYQRLLETDFAPIMVTEVDIREHPRLSMIVKYNLYMRETFQRVLQHINEFLKLFAKEQELGINKEEGLFRDTNGANLPSQTKASTASTFDFNTPLDGRTSERIGLQEQNVVDTPSWRQGPVEVGSDPASTTIPSQQRQQLSQQRHEMNAKEGWSNPQYSGEDVDMSDERSKTVEPTAVWQSLSNTTQEEEPKREQQVFSVESYTKSLLADQRGQSRKSVSLRPDQFFPTSSMTSNVMGASMKAQGRQSEPPRLTNSQFGQQQQQRPAQWTDISRRYDSSVPVSVDPGNPSQGVPSSIASTSVPDSGSSSQRIVSTDPSLESYSSPAVKQDNPFGSSFYDNTKSW